MAANYKQYSVTYVNAFESSMDSPFINNEDYPDPKEIKKQDALFKFLIDDFKG